ncbi:MAG: hypothetical protein IJM67_00285 [Atopobiaceae bacterium]|nr:hypothetical protein [Atopobiaceae bacterium]MBQ3282400.1 hypothetical protein [Atopobiaceae bacterium]MBQ6649670.1 hypothetical protein [Atopobiaceae bacterium]
MRAWDELHLRCARRHEEEHGKLSEQGFAELLAAVRKDPDTFLTHPDDRSFRDLARAIDTFERDLDGDDLLDDDEFMTHSEERRQAMAESCLRMARECPDNLDAQVIATLLSSASPDEVLDRLIGLDEELEPVGPSMDVVMGASAWDDVFLRPRLRLMDTIARACLETARFRMAVGVCEEVLELCRNDEMGTHHTLALALVRLEDEDRFYFLSQRYEQDAWYYLANALLLYKLDRLPAARRALNGLASQCRGGAYALMRPVFVESYLPDRPTYEPGSFEEAVLAVHEADPIVVDTPDFVNWAGEQPGFAEAARAFAQREGFDW